MKVLQSQIKPYVNRRNNMAYYSNLENAIHSRAVYNIFFEQMPYLVGFTSDEYNKVYSLIIKAISRCNEQIDSDTKDNCIKCQEREELAALNATESEKQA